MPLIPNPWGPAYAGVAGRLRKMWEMALHPGHYPFMVRHRPPTNTHYSPTSSCNPSPDRYRMVHAHSCSAARRCEQGHSSGGVGAPALGLSVLVRRVGPAGCCVQVGAVSSFFIISAIPVTGTYTWRTTMEHTGELASAGWAPACTALGCPSPVAHLCFLLRATVFRQGYC